MIWIREDRVQKKNTLKTSWDEDVSAELPR